MRLLLCIHEFPPVGGGAATAASQIARALAELGHEVVVLTSGVSGLPEEEKVGDLLVRRLPSLRTRRFAPKSHELISFCGSLWWRIGAEIRRAAPDGVLAFFAVPAGYFAVSAARRAGIPTIVSLRGSDVPGFKGKRLTGPLRAVANRLAGSAMRRADAVAPNCESLRQLALTFLPEIASKTVVIGNGIEPEWVSDRPANSGQPELQVIQVGQLIARKRVEMTIRAVAELRKGGVPVSLTVIGEGPLADALQRMAGSLDVQPFVRFLGYQTRSAVFDQLRCHDVMVMTSQSEGMSNAVLEGLASGLPVVTTKNGVDQVVRDAKAGIVLPAAEEQELVSALRQLVDSPQLRGELGSAGLEFARQHTWTQSAEQFVELLKSLRQGGHATSSLREPL